MQDGSDSGFTGGSKLFGDSLTSNRPSAGGGGMDLYLNRAAATKESRGSLQMSDNPMSSFNQPRHDLAGVSGDNSGTMGNVRESLEADRSNDLSYMRSHGQTGGGVNVFGRKNKAQDSRFKLKRTKNVLARRRG